MFLYIFIELLQKVIEVSIYRITIYYENLIFLLYWVSIRITAFKSTLTRFYCFRLYLL